MAFFTQNVKKGGLDTFVVNLLLHWPSTDSITLFCNRSHPGLADLRARVPKHVEVVPYDFLIAQDIEPRFAGWPRLIRLMVKVLFGLAGMPYLVFKARQLFSAGHHLDRLMVINGGYPGGDACIGASIAWATLRPGRLAWHNVHNLVIPYHRSVLRRMKERVIDWMMARSVAGFIGVSSSCIESLSIRSGLNGCRKVFVYNGIEPVNSVQNSSLREELSLPASAQIVLMLAVYEPRKGHDFMIRAMQDVVAAVPEAYLLVCGDGTEKERQTVQKFRAMSPVASHVVLQSHRPDIGNVMGQVQVLVAPSQSYESFGYTVAEAMACALPAVVTNVGGLPEVVENGVTGYVVSPQDAGEFAAKIIHLLRNEALRHQMGKMGLKRFEEHFLAERMTREYVRLSDSAALSSPACAGCGAH
jgi:glycosyltransferase involved in cell wall biosynthesis